ncbi:hypothetical protein [Microbacterium arborescens]|uniref:hypothetical protein n=1 Tax=Microbacterium arborescens TaxID=33883 RepID=UPI0013B44137|nr:hypothetical protein [Microbacterium arborescens]
MMRRMRVAHDVVPAATPGAFLAPDQQTSFLIRGQGDGLDQIADFARGIAAETGDPVVYVEVFWPWETEEHQTWDALRVDVSKLNSADPADWVVTLPPYADLTAEQRAALGIEG